MAIVNIKEHDVGHIHNHYTYTFIENNIYEESVTAGDKSWTGKKVTSLITRQLYDYSEAGPGRGL